MTTLHIPSKMRALQYNQPAQTLELVASHPTPSPNFALKEHLLKVSSIAITSGELTWPFPPEAYTDYSPSVEMSGIVVASPPDSKFPNGSKVYMRTTSPRSGSAREYTIGLERELALQPKNLTANQAASIPVSALTAWQALFVHAGYEPDFRPAIPVEQRKKKILIVGASGSVGIWATQLASQSGFHVTATCHTRNANMVQDLGAHVVVDYTKTSIREWMNLDDHDQERVRFDLVLDCVVPGGSSDAWSAVDPDSEHGGLLLSVAGPVSTPIQWILSRPEGISEKVQGRFFIMESNGEQLGRITELVEAGKCKPVVDSVFRLEDWKEALERGGAGDGGVGDNVRKRVTGKVVIEITTPREWRV